MAVALTSAVKKLWLPVNLPCGSWSIHALSLWICHSPILFALALTSFGWHVAQHTCFFASALEFWWSVFGGGGRTADARSIASLFTTMMYTSAVGALLQLAPSAWF